MLQHTAISAVSMLSYSIRAWSYVSVDTNYKDEVSYLDIQVNDIGQAHSKYLVTNKEVAFGAGRIRFLGMAYSNVFNTVQEQPYTVRFLHDFSNR